MGEMGPDLEARAKSEAPMGGSEAAASVSAGKEGGAVAQDPGAKAMRCLGNREEDGGFGAGGLRDAEMLDGDRNSDVDIIDRKSQAKEGPIEGGRGDTTENSSSFGDTSSGFENNLAMNDGEVESEFLGGNMLGLLCPGQSELYPTRKKLTDHWRRFIHPLKWRCKWLELRINELNSQARKYDRKLAECNQKKKLNFYGPESQDFNAKSLPFPGQLSREKVMIRRKRKRVEETRDVASYMSQHNLFSYFDRKSRADHIPMEIRRGNQGDTIGDSLDFGDGANSLEQILAKIETAKSYICKLKARMDKVLSENPGKFSSVNRLCMLTPKDELTSSDKKQASHHGNGLVSSCKSVFTASLQVSNHNVDDILMPETANSTLGEATPLPDIIESTNQTFRGVSRDNTEEEILMNEQAVEEKSLDVLEFRNQLIMEKKPEEPLELHETETDSLFSSLKSETDSFGKGSSLKSPPICKTYVRSKRRRRSRRVAMRLGSRKSLG
ncbi:uncharacterized protein LOC115684441 isoform X2 [Syzygium oleosum]|uniref:uncharacterized protein LOC115684441 isoform X2 n=1 Tax=Syzygium oleosum TaxID=219896 RepID=UPI0011D2312F|nr:uncharacterized protein LOC115684441 isoform X2 [Syzygium oleosum]